MDPAMTRHASALAATVMLVLGATSSTAVAQGFGYNSGSAGAAASSLGFTASPPTAQNSNVPVVTTPAPEPATTGSVVRRVRTWTRLHQR
jgi:hypothetical protein